VSVNDDEIPHVLADLERDLVGRLDDEQGRWRRRPLVLRVLQLALPVVVVVTVGALLLPGGVGISWPVRGALVAAALALVGVVVAPARPALGERFAQLATAVAVVAFALELAPMAFSAGNSGVGCLSITSLMALVASSATAASLSLSGLPLRPWHRAGLAVAAVLGACATLWHHCAANTVLHVVVGHAVGPALVAGALYLILGWRRRRAFASS
jgi:hypothetical protein